MVPGKSHRNWGQRNRSLVCANVRKNNISKYERMKSILISAMLQSQQAWLPALHEPVKFEDVHSISNKWTWHAKIYCSLRR